MGIAYPDSYAVPEFEYRFDGGPYEGWRRLSGHATVVVIQEKNGDMHEYKKEHASTFRYVGNTTAGRQPAKRKVVIRNV